MMTITLMRPVVLAVLALALADCIGGPPAHAHDAHDLATERTGMQLAAVACEDRHAGGNFGPDYKVFCRTMGLDVYLKCARHPGTLVCRDLQWAWVDDYQLHGRSHPVEEIPRAAIRQAFEALPVRVPAPEPGAWELVGFIAIVIAFLLVVVTAMLTLGSLVDRVRAWRARRQAGKGGRR